MQKHVEECIQEDKGLFNLGWYLAWDPRSKEACLDGNFTAQDLRDISDYMIANSN